MGIDQLVNAYKGNPQPLQAKVQQAQKGQPPGAIPPDLEEAIALQKITELRNSAQAQQAMQAGGAQPSIVEKLRQMLSADQRQQAQPPQMPQMAQGPQAMPQGSPPQGQPPQQPPQPPQGVDALQTNVGQQYAEGGIISNVRHFDNGDLVVDPMGGVIQSSSGSKDDRTLLERLGIFNPENRRALERAERQRREREALGLKPGEIERGRLPDPRASANPFPNAEAQLAASADFAAQSQPKPRVNAAPAASGSTDKAPIPAGLVDLANLPSVGVGRDYEKRMLAEGQKFDPKAYREQFLKEVGTKDLSVYDEMAEELKARKERLNAPKAGFDSLMEYLGAIAQSGGGRNWMEAGAKGAATLSAAQKARIAQQDALVDKILDLGSKKKEAEYNEKLGLFNLTKTEKDKVETRSDALAKSLGLSEDKAAELRQQAVENELNRKAQIRAASISAQDRDNLMSRARALMAVDKTLTLEEAMRRAALAANAASVGGTDARRDKAYIDAKNKIDERFQHLISDTPYGKKQKQLYDNAIADLNATFGISGGGINTLPAAAQTIPAGAKPSDLAVGTVYQTARGPAKWNGKAFEPVQ
jgi:hypothetical protein